MKLDLFLTTAAGTLLGAAVAGAAEPPAAEPLPKPAPAPAVEMPAFPGFMRASRYDVWQYYGVGRQGTFRPRVIYAPAGPYYLYNGASYPWAQNHPMDFQPSVVD